MEKKQTTSLTENSQTFLCLKNQINKFFPMLDFLKIAEHTKVLWPGRIKNWQQTPCICYFSVSLSWSMTNSLMVWIMNSPLDSQLKAWTPAFGMSVDGPHREDVGSPERCSSKQIPGHSLFSFCLALLLTVRQISLWLYMSTQKSDRANHLTMRWNI